MLAFVREPCKVVLQYDTIRDGLGRSLGMVVLDGVDNGNISFGMPFFGFLGGAEEPCMN
jgi:hypothetical protein